MPKIELTDLSLTFTVRQQKRTTFKEYLVRGLFRPSANRPVTARARMTPARRSRRTSRRCGAAGATHLGSAWGRTGAGCMGVL